MASEAKRTPYVEGMEHVRTALWPDLPDGYRRGSITGTGFMHVPAPTCEVCGAVVADTDVHDVWHQSLGKTAAMAFRSDAMTTVIGPGSFGTMQDPYTPPGAP